MILLSRISFTHAKKASTSGFTDCCLLSKISCDDLPLLRLSVWKITAILSAASLAICCAGDNAAPFFAVFTISAYLRLQCALFENWNNAHARRRFDEALKAVPEESRKSSLAYLALKQIQSIYHEDKKLADFSAEERVLHRRLTIKPLVDALFARTKQNQCRVSEKSKTGKRICLSSQPGKISQSIPRGWKCTT